MENCIFCKIVHKEAESKVIFETENCLALLPIEPANAGHALVISKAHFENISDAADYVLAEIITIAKKIGEAAKKELGATGYNILNASGKDAQQSVLHLHFHIVPRFPDDKLDLWFSGESVYKKETKEVYDAYIKGLSNVL